MSKFPEMEIWMCPKCNKPTRNWRQCQKCKSDAVLQQFTLVPAAVLDEARKIIHGARIGRYDGVAAAAWLGEKQ